MTEWNPLARREPVTVPLECSGGQASATYAPWSARERLAYEDAMTTRLLTEDGAGEETVRLGTMRLVALGLTLQRLDGFPPGYEEPTEEHLLTLDAEVYAEILRHALEVQPLPSGDKPDEPAAELEGDTAEGGDPFPTPPTPPTGSARRRAPAPA
jgi:hypothetical protein